MNQIAIHKIFGAGLQDAMDALDKIWGIIRRPKDAPLGSIPKGFAQPPRKDTDVEIAWSRLSRTLPGLNINEIRAVQRQLKKLGYADPEGLAVTLNKKIVEYYGELEKQEPEEQIAQLKQQTISRINDAAKQYVQQLADWGELKAPETKSLQNAIMDIAKEMASNIDTIEEVTESMLNRAAASTIKRMQAMFSTKIDREPIIEKLMKDNPALTREQAEMQVEARIKEAGLGQMRPTAVGRGLAEARSRRGPETGYRESGRRWGEFYRAPVGRYPIDRGYAYTYPESPDYKPAEPLADYEQIKVRIEELMKSDPSLTREEAKARIMALPEYRKEPRFMRNI